MSKKAKADGGIQFHPLLPPPENEPEENLGKYAEENIVAIMVGRHDADKFRCALRRYTPDELRDLGTLHAAYGGGVYDLMGLDVHNRMVRKMRWTLEGPSKSLNGTDNPANAPQQPQVQAPNPMQGATDPMSAMVGLMGTIVIASMQQTGTIMAAMAQGNANKAPPPDPMAYTAPILEALARFMPQPQAPVVVSPQGPTMLQQMRDLHAFQKEIANPEGKEESTAEIVGAIVPAVGQLVGALLSARGTPVLAPAG